MRFTYRQQSLTIREYIRRSVWLVRFVNELDDPYGSHRSTSPFCELLRAVVFDTIDVLLKNCTVWTIVEEFILYLSQVFYY